VTRKLNSGNQKRELAGLLEAMDAYGLPEGLILTENSEEHIDMDGRAICVKPVWKWLME
jgi:hypothetical protein